MASLAEHLAAKSAKPVPKPEAKRPKLKLGWKPQPEAVPEAAPAPIPAPAPAPVPEPPLPPYTIRVLRVARAHDRAWIGTASVELVIAGAFGMDIHSIVLFARRRGGIAVRLPYRKETGKEPCNSIWLHSDKVSAEIAAAVNAAWSELLKSGEVRPRRHRAPLGGV